MATTIPPTTTTSTSTAAKASIPNSSLFTYLPASASLAAPGTGSGLDINGIVTKLMSVEQLPLNALGKKNASAQTKLSAFGTLKSGIATFQTAVKKLSSTAEFGQMKATAADTAILSATTTSIAKPGTYSVEVTSLAQAQNLTTTSFTDPSAAIGTGTLTIDLGTFSGGSFTSNAAKTATSIEIDATNNSLTGIRDAINNSAAGVSASIINDGSGYRLVIASKEAGTSNSIRIAVTDDQGNAITDGTSGLSRLAFDPEAAVGAGKNLTVAMAASDAVVKINGVTVTKTSNSISDAIPGVTLNLLKKSAADTPTTLTVASDTTGLETAVTDFVKAYNELDASLAELGGYNVQTRQGGPLLGDYSVRNIQSKLRNLIVAPFTGGSATGFSSLGDVGITFQRDGTLAVDASTLHKALSDTTKNVAGLFAKMGVTSDSQVSFYGSTSVTTPGSYGVDITQMATQGKAVGSVAAATTITTSNNALSLEVNGLAISIQLDVGSYTASSLASALQAKINTELQGTGLSAGVSQSGGVLTLFSSTYGRTSTIAITAGTGATDLFGTPEITDGVDVAGTIGDMGATGSGQILTGDNGIELLIAGGSAGSRGTVDYFYGYANQLNEVLTDLLSATGSIANSTGNLNAQVKDLENRAGSMKTRLEQIEANYRRQFNALDSAVASMQQTSTYLSQQLSKLPSFNKSD